MRLKLWPHHSSEALLAEMVKFCADPERFGQFLFLSAQGEPQGLVEVAVRTDYVNGTVFACGLPRRHLRLARHEAQRHREGAGRCGGRMGAVPWLSRVRL